MSADPDMLAELQSGCIFQASLRLVSSVHPRQYLRTLETPEYKECITDASSTGSDAFVVGTEAQLWPKLLLQWCRYALSNPKCWRRSHQYADSVIPVVFGVSRLLCGCLRPASSLNEKPSLLICLIYSELPFGKPDRKGVCAFPEL